LVESVSNRLSLGVACKEICSLKLPGSVYPFVCCQDTRGLQPRLFSNPVLASKLHSDSGRIFLGRFVGFRLRPIACAEKKYWKTIFKKKLKKTLTKKYKNYFICQPSRTQFWDFLGPAIRHWPSTHIFLGGSSRKAVVVSRRTRGGGLPDGAGGCVDRRRMTAGRGYLERLS